MVHTVPFDDLKISTSTVQVYTNIEFNLKDINKLNKPEDVSTPEYRQIKDKLINLKKELPFIKYASIIIRKTPESAYYIVDWCKQLVIHQDNGEENQDTTAHSFLG